MLKKAMHIVVLCLFVVTTTAASYASCECPMSQDKGKMTIPCHQAANDEGSSSEYNGGCCSDSCACFSGCTSASIFISPVNFATNVVLNKYSISPSEFLDSLVLAVPGSPPKHLP